MVAVPLLPKTRKRKGERKDARIRNGSAGKQELVGMGAGSERAKTQKWVGEDGGQMLLMRWAGA